MFQTYTHIQRRRGRDGSSRLEYLQALVNEYKEASRQDVKRKVLANLSNFAYDPINYEWLYQLDTAKLFIDAVYNLDDDAQLQRIGVFGLCNYALDYRIQQRLANDHRFVCQCKSLVLASEIKQSDDLVATSLCLLWHICTPQNISTIATPDLKVMLEGKCSLEECSSQMRNMCHIFLDDFFAEAPIQSQKRKWCS